jgi:antitoxin (DNA-binding transcriptional repressor) of toxin-antitoxin stability system
MKASMSTVNMLEAKSSLSRLVEAIESGEEAEIIIARNGRPAARLVPLVSTQTGKRIGVAKGRAHAIKPAPALDAAVAKLLRGK